MGAQEVKPCTVKVVVLYGDGHELHMELPGVSPDVGLRLLEDLPKYLLNKTGDE